MRIADIMEKQIRSAGGNLHDIAHFVKVHGYAETIGHLEGISAEDQFILEAAAVIHDIAIPLCREKYGKAPGYLQEAESDPLVRAFFSGTDLTAAQVDRIADMVSHHHTPGYSEDQAFCILLEADYLVNANESQYSRESILSARETVYRTNSGKRLLDAMYLAGPQDLQ